MLYVFNESKHAYFTPPPERVLKQQEEFLGIFNRMGIAYSKFTRSYSNGVKYKGEYDKIFNVARPSTYYMPNHPNVHPLYHDKIMEDGSLGVMEAISGNIVKKASTYLMNDGQFYDQEYILNCIRKTTVYLINQGTLVSEKPPKFCVQEQHQTQIPTFVEEKDLVATYSLQRFGEYLLGTDDLTGLQAVRQIRDDTVNNQEDLAFALFYNIPANTSLYKKSTNKVIQRLVHDTPSQVHVRTKELDARIVQINGVNFKTTEGIRVTEPTRINCPVVFASRRTTSTHLFKSDSFENFGTFVFGLLGARDNQIVHMPTPRLAEAMFESLGYVVCIIQNITVPPTDNDNAVGRKCGYTTDITSIKECFKLTEEEKVYYKSSKLKPIFLGIEIEVNTVKESNEEVTSVIKDIAASPLGKDFIMKHDGSIGDYGFELVSVPASLKYLKKSIEDGLYTNGLYKRIKATPRCGIHVHISKNSFTKLSFGKFIAFINKKENLPFIRDLAGREENKYCLAWKLPQRNSNRAVDTSASVASDVIKNFSGTSLRRSGDSWKSRSTKNFTRGTVNVGKNQTIEVRLFKSSVSMVNIFRKLELCHALTVFANSGVSIQKLNVETFLAFLLEKENKGSYPNLMRCLGSKNYITSEQRVNPITNKIHFEYKLKA